MPHIQDYLVSLPERTIRAGAALAGGLVAETANVLVPNALRRTRLYQAIVARLLRITIELIGDVQGVLPADDLPVRELLARKTAGNVVELAGVLTLGWSPLWLLAGAADLSGGTRVYLQTLTAELKSSRLLPPSVDISSVDELLAALEETSGVAATTVDLPPLNLAALRTSWQTLREQAGTLPDANSLATLFGQLQQVAAREQRSILEVSSLVAAGAIRAGLQLGNVHLYQYYREALQTIVAEGLLVYLQRVTGPYVKRAIRHYHPTALTYTERYLRKRRARR